MAYWGFPKYVSVADKKAKAAKKLKQLKKKIPDIKPVILETNTLARTWWGKSWNKNLERYADYENRIERGRSYVRHGAVLDLKIHSGKVRALVMGSGSQPYEVLISIDAIKKKQWKELQKQCEGQLKSLQDLLAGKFPKGLGEIFFNEKTGLFPSPKNISFDCSCPDWASMCKHVAAVLYGVGARLDEDPSLFFKLRGVNTEDLLAGAIEDTAGKLLEKSKKKGANVIDDADLSDIFGIDMDMTPDFGKKKKTAPAAAAVATPKQKKKAVASTPTRKQSNQKKSGNATAHVAELITASTTGMNIDQLAEKTGYVRTKLYGIVQRLKKKGIIKNTSYGVYEKS
ncbi:hypothetical protein [Desulfosediminicola flagellatus]|uniref:SWIM zinc finger family protein n=1 Tax=Desulfosediminicola flagellatus TaxID=2569541 RepID=UPI0010AC6F2B|nr:hypothetical protein [Desulfosediminicola flagellatus]